MYTYLFIYSFSVKEEDDHMVVEIKKADGYMVSIAMYPVNFNGFHYVRQLYLFFFLYSSGRILKLDKLLIQIRKVI